MDTGAKRSLGDVLRLRGEERYVPLAAVLMRVYLWELVPYQAMFALSTRARRRRSSVWWFRQMM